MKTLLKGKWSSLPIPETTPLLNESIIDYSNEDNFFRLYYKIVSYANYFLHACVVFLFAKYKKYILKNSTELSFRGEFLKCIPLLTEFIFRRNKIYSHNKYFSQIDCW